MDGTALEGWDKPMGGVLVIADMLRVVIEAVDGDEKDGAILARWSR